ncbi:MAG: hypothetical protein KF812_08265 [Fimbriimonadaceae bacterium]|nr:hypothetical protein [Fimbriimonadaceae bacterium]
MERRRIRLTALAGLWLASSALFAAGLQVEVGTRDRDTDAAIEGALKRVGSLARESARAQRLNIPERMPLLTNRVVLTRNGQRLPFDPGGRAPGDLTLQFQSSGSRAFPTAYQTHLQNTFNQAVTVMNAVFGMPKSGINVKVLNYDADIPDRTAVAGGAYVSNAPGGPEIRFPVFSNPTAASIHFIHCLLLAYQADTPVPTDAWNEGLVRAAVMQISRTPNALTGNPDSQQIEAVLDAAYDVSPHYEWWNQPSLGAPNFIAPNLLNGSLPAGGSTGGIFLLRFQMAGTAWATLLAEYPAFLSQFNARYQASPGMYTDEAALIPLGQQVINTIRGSSSATVEGYSFADWVERQGVLDPVGSAGLKLHVQAFPLTPTAGTSDFGVFAIVLNAFRLDAAGNETLLAGRSYPIYWREDWTRFFTTAQDDVIDVAGAYGSVAPNFFANNGQAPYRVAVDVPFNGSLQRVYLPAGATGTGADPTSRDIFGTLRGVDEVSGTYSLSITGTRLAAPITLNVQRFAFGAVIADPNFQQPQQLTIQVLRNGVVLFTRTINKGQGPVALDLAPPQSDADITWTLPAGLSLAGPGGSPWRSNADEVLGLTSGNLLLARWNSIAGKYDLYPDEGGFQGLLGYYLNVPSATSRTFAVRREIGVPVSLPLRPGWNMVVNPFDETVPFNRITATTGTEAVATYNEARGSILGTTMFALSRDNTNINVGTLTAISSVAARQAFFVRCDRPEGGALILTPNAQARGRSSVSRLPRPDWEMQVNVTAAGRPTASASFGQSRIATRGADRLFDSDLPPSAGGLQISVNNLYRDISGPGRSESFTVRLTGLVPGQQTTLFIGRKERPTALVVVDRTTGRRMFWRRGGTYRFVPTSTTQTFDILTGVVR